MIWRVAHEILVAEWSWATTDDLVSTDDIEPTGTVGVDRGTQWHFYPLDEIKLFWSCFKLPCHSFCFFFALTQKIIFMWFKLALNPDTIFYLPETTASYNGLDGFTFDTLIHITAGPRFTIPGYFNPSLVTAGAEDNGAQTQVTVTCRRRGATLPWFQGCL